MADLVLLAYKVAEDPKVLLPAIVNLDGFYLSFTRERVDLPLKEDVDAFLPEYSPKHPISRRQPVSIGTAVMEGYTYSYFRYNMHAAALRAREVFAVASGEFERRFGRDYGPVEGYMLDDAEYVLLMSNSFTALGKQAVKKMRSEGMKAGLLKLRMVRPFPAEEVSSALKGRKAVAVFDQNLAPGSGGILYPEVLSALYHTKGRPETVLPVIGGLGGKQITSREMASIFDKMREAGKSEGRPEPYFLMRDDELRRVKRLTALARGTGA